MHLVTRIHFRSHDKDGSYTIRSAIPENPMLHANITALCLIERELLLIEILHCGNRNFRPFWLLWPWPWPDDHIRTRPVVRVDIPHVQMNFLRQGFRKLSSDRQRDIHTYRQTDIQTRPKLYSTMLRGWSKETKNPEAFQTRVTFKSFLPQLAQCHKLSIKCTPLVPIVVYGYCSEEC